MLKPASNEEIPEMTKLIAQAAFPEGSVAMTIRDEMGTIFEDEQFTELYPRLGQPAESPGRLALITILQFVENLTDRQAVQAVRGRIDWKYALGLELSDAGFHYSILSEFRQRLISGRAEQILLEKVLERCEMKGLLKGKKKQRTDSTHVLMAVRSLTLLELAGETMKRALNDIARVAPEWLQNIMKPEWGKRYSRRFDSYRLPKTDEKRLELALVIGMDGYYLLTKLFAEDLPIEIRRLAIVEIMRQIWVQQFYLCDDGVYWRTKKKWGQPPANKMRGAIDDPDAKYRVKRNTEWTGYQVHLTETCAQNHPRLITHVATTPATKHDSKLTNIVHDRLASRDLRPEMHFVDEGYMETNLLLKSQENGIDLIGLIPSNKSWQDRTVGGLDHTQFQINWTNLVATCPAGKQSRNCSKRVTWRGSPNLMFSFDPLDCKPCHLRARCTRAKTGGRSLTIYPQREYETLLAARERQQTEAFKQLYNQRAGIEGTISQGVRRMGLRRSRYIGIARTHLQHVATASAINLVRVVDWLTERFPEPTRTSPFQALVAS